MKNSNLIKKYTPFKETVQPTTLTIFGKPNWVLKCF